MDKDEIIGHVANDILNSWNIGQIVTILRENAISSAVNYYEGLNEADREELKEKVIAAKTQREEKAKEDSDPGVDIVSEPEVVS